MAKRTTRETAASAEKPIPALAAAAVMELPIASSHTGDGVRFAPSVRRARALPSTAGAVLHNTAVHDEHGSNRQAELFYLQKQIQLQTQMVFILEDKTRIQGVIEWYDRQSIKVRGKSRVLIYKSAIKYLYKAGELGTHSD